MKWTLSHINQLLKEGKIRAAVIPDKPKKLKANKGKVFVKPSKEKAWIGWYLKVWCAERGLDLENEYKFDPEREYRFDFCIPAIKVAIEYEGLMSAKSGHTTVTGYTKDTDKYHLAEVHGYRVIRLTALNYKSLPEKLNRLHPN